MSDSVTTTALDPDISLPADDRTKSAWAAVVSLMLGAFS